MGVSRKAMTIIFIIVAILIIGIIIAAVAGNSQNTGTDSTNGRYVGIFGHSPHPAPSKLNTTTIVKPVQGICDGKPIDVDGSGYGHVVHNRSHLHCITPTNN